MARATSFRQRVTERVSAAVLGGGIIAGTLYNVPDNRPNYTDWGRLQQMATQGTLARNASTNIDLFFKEFANNSPENTSILTHLKTALQHKDYATASFLWQNKIPALMGWPGTVLHTPEISNDPAIANAQMILGKLVVLDTHHEHQVLMHDPVRYLRNFARQLSQDTSKEAQAARSALEATARAIVEKQPFSSEALSETLWQLSESRSNASPTAVNTSILSRIATIKYTLEQVPNLRFDPIIR